MSDFFNRSLTAGSEPLVSVVMNCYNGEKYLREAINSVLAQTYQNWEVVFWDNQSADQSTEIFKSYADPRFKYFYAPKHTSLYEARSYALDKTNGEYIAFLDVDDWWEPEKLKMQIPLFQDEDVGLVYGNFWLVNERKNKNKIIAHHRTLPQGTVLDNLLQEYVVGMLTMVVRRSAIMQLNKIFDPRYQIIGDFDLAIRLAVQWKFACIQQPIATYRWHGDNLSITDACRQFDELALWIVDMENHPIIMSNKNLKCIFNKIIYGKVLNALNLGERTRAWSLFLGYPWCVKKLRLLIAVILPFSIIKKLRA